MLGFKRPFGLLVGAWAFGFLLPQLDLAEPAAGSMAVALRLVTTVAGVWAVYRLVDVVCGFLAQRAAETENRFDDMLVPLLQRSLKVLVATGGLVFVVSIWSGNVLGLITGLSVGGAALAFAGRDSLENVFGTFTILAEKPFQIGDWIISGDLEGTVEEVGFRSTRIRTFYNSVISVPNRSFIASPVDNLGKRRYRRIKTTLGLAYDTPAEKVEAFCEGVRQLIRSHPYTRKDYYHVYFNQFGSNSLDVMLYCFVETPDWSTELRERQRLFADILRLSEKLKVSFAFPTQTIHVAKPEDMLHPDRPSNDLEGAAAGRRVADEVFAASMAPFGGAGAVPPPVQIQEEAVADSQTDERVGGDGGGAGE